MSLVTRALTITAISLVLTLITLLICIALSLHQSVQIVVMESGYVHQESLQISHRLRQLEEENKYLHCRADALVSISRAGWWNRTALDGLRLCAQLSQ